MTSIKSYIRNRLSYNMKWLMAIVLTLVSFVLLAIYAEEFVIGFPLMALFTYSSYLARLGDESRGVS